MDSGYSFVFDFFSADNSPKMLPKMVAIAFMCYYRYETTRGPCYHGYVQFAMKTSVEKLAITLGDYLWLKSDNDPRFYGAIAAHPDAICYGQPRLKLNLRKKATSLKEGAKLFIGANIKQEINDRLTGAVGELINNFDPSVLFTQ